MVKAHIIGKQVINIKVFLKTIKEMDMDFKFGLMEENMKVNGKMENIMDKGLLHGQLERLIREILKKIKETVVEYLYIKMEINLMDNGNKTKNVV